MVAGQSLLKRAAKQVAADAKESAEGAADAYPRFGPTSEWDTAAADAILRAAGGITLGGDGQPLAYGKARYLNGPFLAVADPTAPARLPGFAA